MDTAYLDLEANTVYNLKDAVLTVPGTETRVALQAGKKYLIQNRGNPLVFIGEFSAAPGIRQAMMCIDGTVPWAVQVRSEKGLYVRATKAVRIVVTEA